MSFCTRPIVPAISAVAAPIDRDDRQRHRRVREQHGVAPDHVDAGRHHRRRVDQRGDRRRAFHRVRQPDVERNLRRLAGRAEEQQQRRDRHRRRTSRLGRAARQPPRATSWKSSVPNVAKISSIAEDEAEVADAVDDERLLAGVGRRLLLEPEADQQVRAEADALPADEHHQEVGAEHEHEHERREQVQVREVARVLARRVSSCM